MNMQWSVLLFLGLGVINVSAQTLEVTSTGVGIGTATPSNALDVKSAGSSTVIGLQTSGQAADALRIMNSDGSLRISNGATANLLNLVGGNVGIGATNPGAKLEIIGGANPFGLIVEGDGTNANARIALRRANATGVSATGNIDWIGNDNAVGARIGVNDDIGGSMAFKLGGSAQSYTRLFISSAGDIGIGTSSPGQKLEVAGIGRFTGTNAFSIGEDAGFARIQKSGTGDFGFLTAANAYAGIKARSASIGANYGDSTAPTSGMIVEGNVGIGTTSPSYKLHVAGTVRATSFISDTTTYADFVFKPGYKLASLSEVEAHINDHGTLPGVPSESEVAKEGIDLAQLQVKLLQKVEELTLHLIRMEKENGRLRQRVEQLESAPQQ